MYLAVLCLSWGVWDLVPWPRIKPGPLHWDHGVLATGPPEKSLFPFFKTTIISPFNLVQLLSCVQLFATPWTAALQASLSITNSWSLLKLMSIESVMPSNRLILCHPLLLPPSIFPSIRVFSNTTVQKHQFFSAQLSLQSNSHIHTWLLEKP